MSYAPPPPEPESLPAGRVAIAVVVTMVIVAGATAAGRLLERASTPPRRALPSATGQPEIGRQFQRPFAIETTAAAARARQHERLESYGWVDRKRELIHLPIERAFDRVLEQEGEEGR